MFIRHLIGPRKGEVEDIVFESAKAKIISGEAEDVYHQLGLQPKTVSIAAVPAIQAPTFIGLDLSTKTETTTAAVHQAQHKKKFRR